MLTGWVDEETQSAALAAFGLKLDGNQEPQSLGLWPENVHTFNVFCRVRNQWNVGTGGALGLRYEVLGFALELEQVPREQWPDVVTGVQVMEAETLRYWREKSNKE